MTDSFKTRASLKVGPANYTYFSLKALEKRFPKVRKLPFSLRILLENLLRYEDGRSVTKDDIEALATRDVRKPTDREIAFRPARVLLQDFTGVPAVVDLATMREALAEMGGNPDKINPLAPADLVIDHSVIVDQFATSQAFGANAALEFNRNRERYAFLRWGQNAFRNFRVVPPDTGICHQVNLEYLASVVFTGAGKTVYPDTLVGTDSHTTMINGLGVLGWGVGGIEAEAALLGQPQSMLIPDVIGMKLVGTLPPGATATDLVLTVTQMLRKKGVVGKFVEFYGPGVARPRADRPRDDREHGARVRRDDGLFPRRRRDDQVPEVHEPAREDRRPRRGLLQEAGPLPHEGLAGPGLHGHPHAQPQGRRAFPRGAEAAAGPGAAEGLEEDLQRESEGFLRKGMCKRRSQGDRPVAGGRRRRRDGGRCRQRSGGARRNGPPLHLLRIFLFLLLLLLPSAP